MDQDETQATAPAETASLEGAVPTEAPIEEAGDEPKRGRVLQTFQVRLTLRANEDGTEGTVPTNERLAEVIETAVYQQIEDFDRAAIRATAELV